MSSPDPSGGGLRIPALQLNICDVTSVSFGDKSYQITFRDNRIRISLDYGNYTILSPENQEVAYKARILGGPVLSEETVGAVDYQKDFSVHWEDFHAGPDIVFLRRPRSITRVYIPGQSIELGLEYVQRYHLLYEDNVTADFVRVSEEDFEFSFSTGFYGNFHLNSDGSYSLHFKGDRLNPGEDSHRSQSKFMISRSKYTGNLMLYLRDKATVTLS